MICEKIVTKIYQGDTLSLLTRIGIGLHLLFCSDCTREIERYEKCRDILRNEFFPQSPGLEDSIMAMVAAEKEEAWEAQRAELSGGFSLRGWVIAGLVMFVSLATAFFGLDFNKVALASGISFMIPIGITIGIALTCYGALFIGCHLKEFSERFGL